MFLVPLFKAMAILSYIRHLTCIICKSVYSILVYFLCNVGLYFFHELLNSIGGFERCSYVGLFEKICNFPYFRTIVCESGPYLVFISIVLI